MNNVEFAKKVTDNYHQSLLNLTKAIQDAGGCVDLLEKNMTLQDLLMACSINSVIISAKHVRPKEINTHPSLEIQRLAKRRDTDY